MDPATETKAPPAYILKLPDEILQEISYDLTPVDVDRFKRTNQRLYGFIKRRPEDLNDEYRCLKRNPPLMGLDRVALKSELESKDHSDIDQLISPEDATIPGGIESSEKYRMLLCWAAGRGHTAAVRNLLGYRQVDIGKRDEHGRDALWFAVANGHDEVVKLFVDMDGYEIDQPDDEGRTPLACAVQENHVSTARLLLRTSRVNPNSMTRHKETPLIIAVDRGLLDMVNELLTAEDLNLNAGRLFLTLEDALILSVRKKNVDIFMSLLKSGKPVNLSAAERVGYTAVHELVLKGFDKTLLMLLESREVKVDTFNNGGLTPLAEAVFWGRISTCRILLEKGKADANLGDGTLGGPLEIAASHGHTALLKFLLEEGKAEVDGISPERSHTPLLKAALEGHLEAVRLLLQKGADPHRPDGIHGGTALHVAIRSTDRTYDIVQELLKHAHVNIELKDNKGRTPLSVAASKTDPRFAQMLLDKGADLYSEDETGMTPIDWAKADCCEATLAILESKRDAMAKQQDTSATDSNAGHSEAANSNQSGEAGCNSLKDWRAGSITGHGSS